jgi:hypothetical protein
LVRVPASATESALVSASELATVRVSAMDSAMARALEKEPVMGWPSPWQQPPVQPRS